jgi:FAD/FMN-containing dehydrogenase
VVTADGRLLRTDDQHHPELFWAIRGGGGNFGVATRFQFRPPEQPDFHPTAVSRTMLLDDLDHDAAAAILWHLHASTAPVRVAQLRVLGGAMARVPAEATAFAHRTSRLMVNLAAVYQRPGEAADHRAWVDRFAAALDAGGAARAYVNFLGEEGPARIRQAYPGSTWQRLAAVKARYDPTNLFHHNHNIPPTTADPDGEVALET